MTTRPDDDEDLRRLQRRRRGPARRGHSRTRSRTSTTSSTAATRRAEDWSAGQGFGNTPYEEATGESLEQRIAQEEKEPDPYDEAERAEGDEDLDDGEVGAERAGRLVDPDEGTGEDTENDLIGDDVGIDGAAASAEEAAVHVVPEPGDY